MKTSYQEFNTSSTLSQTQPLAICDSHFHSLEMARKGLAVEELIKDFFTSGGSYLLEIAITEEEFAYRQELTNRFPGLYLSAGIHPVAHSELSSNEFDQKLKIIEEQVQKEKVVAIGEIGIDLFHNTLPLDEQIKRFEKQIDIAQKYKKPVIIHSRESLKEVINVLSKKKPSYGGIVHCYTGTPEQAENLLDLGFYLGFGGVLTYSKNTEHIQETVRTMPSDRWLSETDAPYLTPRKYGKQPNQPAFVQSVVNKMSKLRPEYTEEIICKQINQNFETLFLHKKITTENS